MLPLPNFKGGIRPTELNLKKMPVKSVLGSYSLTVILIHNDVQAFTCFNLDVATIA